VVLVGFVCFLERGSATQFIFAIVFSWVSRSLREETSVEAMSFTSCKRGLWFIAKPLNLYPPPPLRWQYGLELKQIMGWGNRNDSACKFQVSLHIVNDV
jgi:hypothetical protein